MRFLTSIEKQNIEFHKGNERKKAHVPPFELEQLARANVSDIDSKKNKKHIDTKRNKQDFQGGKFEFPSNARHIILWKRQSAKLRRFNYR